MFSFVCVCVWCEEDEEIKAACMNMKITKEIFPSLIISNEAFSSFKYTCAPVND